MIILGIIAIFFLLILLVAMMRDMKKHPELYQVLPRRRRRAPSKSIRSQNTRMREYDREMRRYRN